MQFETALAVLLQGRPKWDLTPAQTGVWRALMSDIAPDALYAGAVRLVRESPYDPTIAEWRRLAFECAGQGRVGMLMAGEAWEELMRNRRRCGTGEFCSTEKAKWSSELVRRISQTVDWTCADWLTEQIPTIRAQFERYYNAAVERQCALDASAQAELVSREVTKALHPDEQRRLT